MLWKEAPHLFFPKLQRLIQKIIEDKDNDNTFLFYFCQKSVLIFCMSATKNKTKNVFSSSFSSEKNKKCASEKRCGASFVLLALLTTSTYYWSEGLIISFESLLWFINGYRFIFSNHRWVLESRVLVSSVVVVVVFSYRIIVSIISKLGLGLLVGVRLIPT